MAATLSTLKKYGISRDEGATWLVLPRKPNDYSCSALEKSKARLNGTRQVCMWRTVELMYEKMPFDLWYKINGLYRVNDQNILLNYLSVAYDEVAGLVVPRWYYAPAVWSDEPEKGEGSRGTVVSNVVLRFNRVEWYLPLD